ncbi:MAG: putative inorganic carbon transporter subunit DabA [Candidatus Competibacteraceae bacterium]
MRRVLDQACERSAHERCRRFASAPREPTPAQALRHVVERSRDFSQARPELGQRTNAAALVGRRSMSQGLFLDRRAFLISYDPTQDPSGDRVGRHPAGGGSVGWASTWSTTFPPSTTSGWVAGLRHRITSPACSR